MIWVDYREKASGIIDYLIKEGLEYEVKNLYAGDYIVDQRVIVERKTSEDFYGSLHSGRLFRQVAALKKLLGRKLIIIEGIAPVFLKGVNPRSILGAMVSITAIWQLPVFLSEGLEQTAWILGTINRQIAKVRAPSSYGLYPGKKFKDPKIQKRKMLESLPLIGPKFAGELLNKFGSLEKIFSASEKELLSIRGIGRNKVAKIKEILKEEKARYGRL